MYICGFNRDRDSYQVPLALYEGQLLDKFVTDFYYSNTLPLRSLNHRRNESLPDELTLNSLAAFLVQGAWKTLGKRFKVSFPEIYVNELISKQILNYAKRSNSDFFIYNGFAAVFSQDFAADRRKVLFQYHPTPEYVKSQLEIDYAINGRPLTVNEPELLNYSKLKDISDEELKFSDTVFCASSVTKKSLELAGVPTEQIRLVPYGFPEFRRPERSKNHSDLTNFIFVGSGIRRKGIHILVEAFNKFHKRDRNRLFIIARKFEKGLDLEFGEGITVINGLTSMELSETLSNADVLVLPSYVEGFGLVITEALSHGTHVVSSEYTCLNDLNLDPVAVTSIEGELSVSNLITSLEIAQEKVQKSYSVMLDYLEETIPGQNWGNFRFQIRSELQRG